MANTWFGLTPEEKEQAIEETRNKLIDRARKGLGPVTYSELFHSLRKPPTALHRSAGILMSEIAVREKQLGRPPLEALVVSAATGLPGKGLWPMLERDGQDISNIPVAWTLALKSVYEFWHKPREHQSK